MPAESDQRQGTPHGVVSQGVAEAVVADGLAPVPVLPPQDVRMAEVEYPDTDGLPMADNDFQAVTMHYAGPALARHFEGRGYVATDTILYYVKGNSNVYVAPDVMVVLGVDGSLRHSFMVWEEGGRIPDFVLEVVSNSKQQKDARDKRKVYSKLGVREYFRYSPNSNRMDGMDGRRLVGETLREGQWEPLPRLEEERISSAVLGLELRVRKRNSGGSFRELRFHDPGTGEDLPTRDEALRARDQERRGRREALCALEEERQGRLEALRARDRTERENVRLRAMLERLSASGARHEDRRE